jgi:hypothetical protein
LWIVVPVGPTDSVKTGPLVEEQPINKTPLQCEYPREKRKNGRTIFGLFLVVLGVFFLLREFDIIPLWLDLGKLWPLFIIVPGILMITKSRRKDPCDNGWGSHQHDESQTESK